MVTVTEILEQAVAKGASDIFITSGTPVMFKTEGEIAPIDTQKLMPLDTTKIIETLFQLSGRDDFDAYLKTGDSDFSLSLAGVGRFRVNAFRQRNSPAAVIRVVRLVPGDPELLRIPAVVTDLYKKTRGLVLVTGPAGAGKSTTLATLINLINERRNCHILTLEDPVEYLHAHSMSIVNQREVESDTHSYAKALRAALRQSPDVILVGEMRDIETMSTALTAAETGHLVFSTLHTIGAAKTIDRIIDVFPPSQQQQVRIQLSTVLQAVISQQLIPSRELGQVAVFETMFVNGAIRNLIRESKTHQIDTAIQSGASLGMRSMDDALADACKRGLIDREDAYIHAVNQEVLRRYLEES